MALAIRSATLDDVEVLRDLQQVLVSWERPYDKGIPSTGIVEYYDVRTLIGKDDIEYLVAELDGEVVGCIFGEIRKNDAWAIPERYGYVGLFSVKNGFRGQGIGKEMLDRIVDWFRSREITEIRLKVYEGNLRSVDFYKRYGFNGHIKEMRLG